MQLNIRFCIVFALFDIVLHRSPKSVAEPGFGWQWWLGAGSSWQEQCVSDGRSFLSCECHRITKTDYVSGNTTDTMCGVYGPTVNSSSGEVNSCSVTKVLYFVTALTFISFILWMLKSQCISMDCFNASFLEGRSVWELSVCIMVWCCPHAGLT